MRVGAEDVVAAAYDAAAVRGAVRMLAVSRARAARRLPTATRARRLPTA
jgi:hypothetical protein